MPTSLSCWLTLWYVSAFSFFLISAFGIMYYTINQILVYRIDETGLKLLGIETIFQSSDRVFVMAEKYRVEGI